MHSFCCDSRNLKKKPARYFTKFHESQTKQDFKSETSLIIATFVQISTIICLTRSFLNKQYIAVIYYRLHQLQYRSWFSLKFLDEFSVSDHYVYKGCWFHPITSDLWSFFFFFLLLPTSVSRKILESKWRRRLALKMHLLSDSYLVQKI